MNFDDLVASGEAMQEALGREYYLTGAGACLHTPRP